MNRFSNSLILTTAALLLLVPVSRLPAPIQEVQESPTPTPKRSHITNKPTNERPASKPNPTQTVSFAGTWTGTATGRIQQAVFGPTGFSSNYNLQISPDERTATWTSSAWTFAKFQAPVQKKGRTLNWTCERHDLAGKTAVFCRLEIDANGTARYSESSGLVNGVFKGAGYELSGTLVRQ